MNKLSAIKDNKKISNRRIAKIIGVSRTTIDNGLQGKTEEFKFEVFLKLVQNICDNVSEQRYFIRDFILSCKTPLNIRKVLCYCQAMGEFDLIKQLVRLHEERQEVKKYIIPYKIQNKRNQNEARGQKLLNEIYNNEFSMDSNCQAVLNILYMEAMYDKQNYNAIIPYADRLKVNIEEIDQQYIKECLQMKYKERLAYIYLMKNDIENCRKTCYEILDSPMDISIIKATAWCCLGESYTFECIKTAAKYIKKAISLCEKIQVAQKDQKYLAFKTTLAHLYIANGFCLDEIDFRFISKSELAFYECMYGDKKKGMALYKELLESKEGLSPFQMYSYSKVNNDIMGMKKALELFELTGNVFYSQYVKRELIKEEVIAVE